MAIVVVPEPASGVFSLTVQNVKVITERDSAVVAKAVTLDCLRVVEESATASLASWNFEKNDMICECDEPCAALEGLNK